MRGLAALVGRRRDADLVEARGVHGIDLAHQDVGRHLVLGAAELAERRQESQVVEGLDRQGQAERPRLRAVFGSRHGRKRLRLKQGYNIVKTLGRRIESCKFDSWRGFSLNKLKAAPVLFDGPRPGKKQRASNPLGADSAR